MIFKNIMFATIAILLVFVTFVAYCCVCVSKDSDYDIELKTLSEDSSVSEEKE